MTPVEETQSLNPLGLERVMPLKTGSNMLELVDFRLRVRGREEVFGINVSKVVEIMYMPRPVTAVPGGHPAQLGLLSIRGRAIPVFDMGVFLGLDRADDVLEDPEAILLVAEFSKCVFGFLVARVERIRRVSWESVSPVGSILSGPDGSQRIVGTIILPGEKGRPDGILQMVDLEAAASALGFFQRQETEADTTPNLVAAHGHRILVVDDSVATRKTIVRLLEKSGYTVVQAGSGRQGLDIAKSTPLDLIVSDVEMPEMDGYTLTREVRALERLAHLPVLLHSSMSGQANIKRGQDAGANEYLVKMEPAQLLTAIERFLPKPVGGPSPLP